MSIVLPSARARISQVPFLFRAADCIDENGIFALSYGKRVGGVFARASRKSLVDQRGRVFSVPNGELGLGVFGGEVSVPMEPGSTNLCTWSQGFDNAAWTKQNGSTVTPNAALGADGTLSAFLLEGDGSIGGQAILQTVALADGERCVSWFLREGAGDTRVRLSIYDSTAVVHRHQVRVTWTDGVPSVATTSGAGTIYPPQYHEASGLWRIGFSALDIVGANTNRIFCYAGDGTTNAGSVYVWGAQPENVRVPTSYIKTEGSTVARSTDALYFDLPGLNPPRAMTMYARFVDLGTRFSFGSSPRIIDISNGASGDPRLILLGSSNGANITAHHDNNVDAQVASSVAAVRGVGDVVEARGILFGTGSVQAGATVNGGVEAMSVPTGALGFGLGTAWSAARVHINVATVAGASAGQAAYTHIAIAEQFVDRDTLRALAGVG